MLRIKGKDRSGMKRKLWSIIAVLCACAVLAGCGAQESAGGKTPEEQPAASEEVSVPAEEPEAAEPAAAGGDQIGDSGLLEQADAMMEQYYGQDAQTAGEQSYALEEAYETVGGYYRYIYRVERTSDLLDESFLVWVKIEKNGRVCVPSRLDLDVTEPNREQNREHTWKLEGTYTYSDGDSDYTVVISKVEGDTVTLTYDYYISDPLGSLPREESVDTPTELEIQEIYRGDERYPDWCISTADQYNAINIQLLPYGAELTTGGPGSGMAIEGHWLVRS